MELGMYIPRPWYELVAGTDTPPPPQAPSLEQLGELYSVTLFHTRAHAAEDDPHSSTTQEAAAMCLADAADFTNVQDTWKARFDEIRQTIRSLTAFREQANLVCDALHTQVLHLHKSDPHAASCSIRDLCANHHRHLNLHLLGKANRFLESPKSSKSPKKII
jgi:hypothetical protein